MIVAEGGGEGGGVGGKVGLALGGGQGTDVEGALGWGEGGGAVCVGHVVEQKGCAQKELAAQEPD